MILTISLLQPMPEDSITKVEFVDATVGMNIPKNFIPAIEKVTNKNMCLISHLLSNMKLGCDKPGNTKSKSSYETVGRVLVNSAMKILM